MFTKIIATIAGAALVLTGAVVALQGIETENIQAAQSVALDDAGDQDGTAEIITVNGHRITEISINFDCETMGNQTCGN